MLLFLLVPSALATSSEALVAQVLDEHPELADSTLSDWEVVQALRAFAYTHTDTVVLVDSPLYSELGGWSAADRYAWFDADAGGVVCGGTGDALRELYTLWGYDAWYLGFGDQSDGGFTHVETLVAIEHDGERLVTLHDAQLDASYADADGGPLDYRALLALLAAQDEEGWTLIGHTDNGYADTLVHPDDLGSMTIEEMVAANWTSDPADYTLTELDNGVIKIGSPRTLDRFETVIQGWYGPFLTSENLPDELAYLHLFPLTITGADGAPDLLAAARAAALPGRTWTVDFEPDQGFALGDSGGTVNYAYSSAGFDVQSWYYGNIAIVACDTGQCLEASWVDGYEGDYELMMEFQAHQWARVELTATSTVEGEAIRAAWYDADWNLLDETVSTDPEHAILSPDAPVRAVILEAPTGAVRVDNVVFGPEPPAEDPEDTGHVDSGDTGDTDDTGSVDTDGDTGPDDTGPADTGPVEDSAAADGDPEPDPDRAGCGCRSVEPGWAWSSLVALAFCRRRRR